MSTEEAINKEETKIKAEEALQGESEEMKDAFNQVTNENDWIRRVIGKVAEELSDKDRKKENARRHELAIMKVDAKIFKSIDNEYKERSWERYMKDRNLQRRWKIIYKISAAVITLTAYMMGGYPIMFQYVKNFFGG